MRSLQPIDRFGGLNRGGVETRPYIRLGPTQLRAPRLNRTRGAYTFVASFANHPKRLGLRDVLVQLVLFPLVPGLALRCDAYWVLRIHSLRNTQVCAYVPLGIGSS